MRSLIPGHRANELRHFETACHLGAERRLIAHWGNPRWHFHLGLAINWRPDTDSQDPPIYPRVRGPVAQPDERRFPTPWVESVAPRYSITSMGERRTYT
jgi:hypothetical protein